MSTLSESLNQIMNWRQQFTPEVSALLMPGLTDAEIKALAKELPLELPPEIYELYRWRNGSVEEHDSEHLPYIFGQGFALLPLQVAIERYRQEMRFGKVLWNNLDRLELFFSYFSTISGYMVFDTSKEAYPIVFMHNKDGQISFKYDSLNSMMLTIAEAYEKAYFFDEEGNVIIDRQKMKRIWGKYNSD